MANIVLCFILLVSLGCSSAGQRETTTEPSSTPAGRLMAMPAPALAKCQNTDYITAACPHKLPRVQSDYRRVLTSDEQETPGYRLMSLEWGAAYGGIDRRNSPPRFAHVIIWGGDLDRAFSWEWPDTPIELDDGVPRKREGALLLATRRWTGELGDLVLASPYPSGGMNGDHLVYRWTEGDLELALSLHAWDPISETIGALRAIVRSIPEW